MPQHKQLSRRNFIKIFAASTVMAGAAGAALKFGVDSSTAQANAQTATATRMLMGTVVNLTILSDDKTAAQAAIEATLNRMADLEAQLSRHQPNSQLSRLNQQGELADAGQALLTMLAQAQDLSVRSGGAFDITVKPLVDLYEAHLATHTLPTAAQVEQTLSRVDYRQIRVDGQHVAFQQPGMAITLDGIAKGFIVDEGIAVLKQAGFANVLVEAGGDLMAAGQKADQPWQIGLQSPRQGSQAQSMLGKFAVRNQAAATSGDYMQPYSADLRQHHILDPRQGYSAPELASATVIAPSAMLSDGLATAVMVLGPSAGLALVESLPGCQAYVVSKNLEVGKTAGFGL